MIMFGPAAVLPQPSQHCDLPERPYLGRRGQTYYSSWVAQAVALTGSEKKLLRHCLQVTTATGM